MFLTSPAPSDRRLRKRLTIAVRAQFSGCPYIIRDTCFDALRDVLQRTPKRGNSKSAKQEQPCNIRRPIPLSSIDANERPSRRLSRTPSHSPPPSNPQTATVFVRKDGPLPPRDMVRASRGAAHMYVAFFKSLL